MDTPRNQHDIYDVADIKQRLEPVFRRHGVRSAVLFGSYAKGEARPVSDVDILIDSGLRGLAFIGLSGEIMEALQKDADVIDVHYMRKGSMVDREIQETGVRIYGG